MTAKVLSELEVKRVYKAIQLGTHKDRNRLIFSFGLLAGLRSCELCNLKITSKRDLNLHM